MKIRKKKRALTLIEIMIVIVLIGLIGSVIGVNMKGSLEEGKAFKTRKGIDQITDILMLEVARGASIEDVTHNPETYLENSGLVKNPKTFLKDGWGAQYDIKAGRSGDIIVRSENLKKYDLKKNRKSGGSSLVPDTTDTENDPN